MNVTITNNIWAYYVFKFYWRIKMSTEENKATARQFLEEIINKRNFDFADKVYDDNVIAHTPFGDIKGHQT